MASVDSATRTLSQETLTFEPAMMVSNAREELSPKLMELSNLDQINDFYVSIALYYGTPNSQTKSFVNVGGVLRSALEELLAHYPWAAGRMRVNKHEQRLEVECNGKGVQFVTAHADMMFSELGNVSSPHPSLDLLFPSLRQGDKDPPLVAIQVTTFKCGGFTLSLKNNHTLMDGYSAAVFLQNLCSIARGAGLLVPPDHVSRRERMKPRTPPSPTFQHPYILKKGGGLQYFGNARMYAFSENALEKLRRRILSSSQLAFSTCSRFHALAALLWTARAKSLRGGRLPPGHELSLRVPVSVRERIVPTITRGYMGNATYQAIVRATVQELIESPLPFHVDKIKSAIANVTSESVQSQTDYIEALGAGAHLDHSLLMPMLSLVSLPFYDTDCGWGCPMYCGVPSRQDSNRIVILDGRGSWNVLVVFESREERVLFQETIEEYIIVS